MRLPKLPMLAACAALAAFLGASLWLARLESRGAYRMALELEGGVPATLFLPGPGHGSGFPPPAPPPRGARPPALVLVHGYAGDRAGLVGLAGSIARAGYAVLTLDLRGHGLNRNRFSEGAGRPDHLVPEIRHAVDFLRSSRYVDGQRLSLAGHSMGGGAVLAYAMRDPGIDAVVLIAGGFTLSGPHRPANALFLTAERELPVVMRTTRVLAAQLAGVPEAEPGRPYGDFALGTALRWASIPAVDHASIIRSPAALVEIVDWLDRVYASPRSAPIDYRDPRRPALACLLASLLILLPALGVGLARLSSARSRSGGVAGGRRWLALVAGLVVALPLMRWAKPGLLLGASDADRVVTYLGLAGAGALAALCWARRWPSTHLLEHWPGRAAGAAVGALAIHFLLRTAALELHGLALTPARGLLALGSALVLLPFCLGFHLALRHPNPWRAAALRLAGRLIVLAALAAGLAIGVFAFPGLVALFALIPVYAVLELVFSGYFARSVDIASAAALEALVVASVLIAVLPANL